MDLSLWLDVTPLPLNDGPNPPFRIAYSEAYSQVFGYVRAVQVSGERSARVLQLSGAAVELNPAHYTVWSLRRECLEALGGSPAEELAWLSALIRRKGCWKNYQVWHHRRLMVEKLGDGGGEMDSTAEAFSDDSKNYHAWSHRQWVVRELTGGGAGGGAGTWASERDFAGAMLAEDVRNNSCWNHRWFVLTRGGGAPGALPPQHWPAPADLVGEVAFTVAALGPVRLNEAAWGHLRACALLGCIMGRQQAVQQGAAAAPPAWQGTVEELSKNASAWAALPGALALARDASTSGDRYNALACEVLAEHAEATGDMAAARLFYARAAEGDSIRASYWKWRESRV